MKRIVIKIGTGNLLSRDGSFFGKQKAELVMQEISSLMKEGFEIILVTSGAIKTGEAALWRNPERRNISKSVLAGVGARHLLNLWGDALPEGFELAQIWLTYANWQNTNEYKKILENVISCLESKIIPLVNENDIVADDEIRSMEEGISENDRLARMVAEMVEADGVLFLTKSGGVYDSRISQRRPQILYSISKQEAHSYISAFQRSLSGKGGIEAKITEACKCIDLGMRAAIAGILPRVVLDFAHGKDVGTIVTA